MSQIATTTYKANPDYMVRQVADEYLLVAVSPTAASQNKIMMLNATGYFIWEELQEALTLPELINHAEQAFDTGDIHISEQISDFVHMLIGRGLIIEGSDET